MMIYISIRVIQHIQRLFKIFLYKYYAVETILKLKWLREK